MAHIKTYCRIKPSPRNYDDYDTTNTTLYIRVPEHFSPVSWGLHARSRSSVVNHEFKFNGIFRDSAPQNDVFDTAAKSIVQGFLNGYNGTIFAYGQTGTGKTFTVEGSARSYKDRGIAPRSLSMIYSSLSSRQDEDLDIHVSYMEIYQEIGYDLLNTAARTTSLVTPFPKVAVVEGSKGSCIIRNLSTHLAANEDVAQHLLLQGQANRKVAETPMNQRSSRSHAVFSIYLSAKKHDSDVIVKSKLHLVDLAGSERVSKTGTIGLQLSEAKFINLSLHHLEGVIIALQKEVNNGNQTRALAKRPASANTALDYKLYNRWVNSMRSSTPTSSNVSKFVPYRNSLLTMVLRDSLGGNCQTAMIATISLEPENLSESISTCRFAQRVACITNTLRKNEEIDDRSMIKRLRKKISDLETEVAMLKSNQDGMEAIEYSTLDSKLTDEEKMTCATIMHGYLGGKVQDPVIAGVTSAQKFRECLRLLKILVNTHLNSSDSMLTIAGLDSDTSPVRSNSTETVARPAIAWGDDTGSQSKSAAQRSLSATTVQSEDDVDMFVNKLSSNENKTNEQNYRHNQTDISTHASNNPLNPSVKQAFSNETTPKNNNSTNSKIPVLSTSMSPNSRPNSNTSRNGRQTDSGRRMRPYSGGSIGRREQDRAVSAPAHFREHVFAKTTSYKSPFERKREQEIKKLDKKVEKTQTEIKNQQKHLEQMQSDIKVQQLQVLKKEVSGKFDKTNTQLAEQQAYVKTLQQAQGGSELLEQEKLVEKQLKKRQHKMQKRLELIDQKLTTLNDNDDDDNCSPERHATNKRDDQKKKATQNIERRFSQFVKRDGKVDSRKVIEMLQNKDKKQEKLQDKLEKDKLFALTTQVELKEAATRQKLQEFKDKLRQRQGLESGSSMFSFDASEANYSVMSSTGQSNMGDSRPSESVVMNGPPVINQGLSRTTPVIDSQSGKVQYLKGERNMNSTPANSELKSDSFLSFSDVISQQSDDLSTHSNAQNNKREQDERPTSGSSAIYLSKWAMNNKSTSLSDMDRLKMMKSASKSKPKEWDNVYTTTQPNRKGFEVGPAIDLSDIHTNKIEFSNTSMKDLGYEDFPFTSSQNVSHSEGNYDDSDVESVSTIREVTPGQVEENSGKLDPFQKGYFSHKHSATLYPQKNDTTDVDSFSADYFSNSVGSSKFNQSSSNVSSMSKNTFNGFEGTKNIKSVSKSVGGANPVLPKCNVIIPESVKNITDYEKSQILNNSRSESKDLKQNGEYSTNKGDQQRGGNFERPTYQKKHHSDFDEALSKMLGMGSSSTSTNQTYNKSVTIKPEHYDKYARKDHNTVSRGKIVGRNKGQGSGSKPDKHKTHVTLWGPEAKNISISERLEQYLNMDSFSEIKKPVKGRSYEDSDIHPYHKPSIADDTNTEGASADWKRKQTVGKPRPEIDVDNFHIKIKAMDEEEREETYMTTARQQKARIQKIRQARTAAEVIQKAWRAYKLKT